eukprot:CAMPEP_0197237324 /NCGR_PEP_ID=MMETSP1429-20130617/4186_1 /TAXON_ID=49237 /ORGANISM="Chaetoceros  sp., Strain UNC1202" /LENGTH=167 /DNA_ID=CAMNT_0042696299 /DNA_START=6 /DNA_END=509 /DNA_ORIENTATION=-
MVDDLSGRNDTAERISSNSMSRTEYPCPNVRMSEPNPTEYVYKPPNPHVYKVNGLLADRMDAFVQGMRTWEETLKVEFRLLRFKDNIFAYTTLPRIANEVREHCRAVRMFNKNYLLFYFESITDERSATWLERFASHDEQDYRIEPKANLCTREYRFISEFDIDQSI